MRGRKRWWRRRRDGPTLAAAATAVASEEVLDRVRDEAAHRLDVHGISVALHWLIIAGGVEGFRPNSCLLR